MRFEIVEGVLAHRAGAATTGDDWLRAIEHDVAGLPGAQPYSTGSALHTNLSGDHFSVSAGIKRTFLL